VAGHRPGDDGGVALRDQQAEGPTGAQHPTDRGERGGGVVDDLEDAVAEHHVGAVGAGELEQAAQVALSPGDLDADLVYAASGHIVDTTVVAGRVLMRGGHIDGEAEVRAEVSARAARLTAG
jgi:hypothetical protein